MTQRVDAPSEKPPGGDVKPWYVYLVRAANGSLYCGISDDPQRRFLKHQRGRGALLQDQPGPGAGIYGAVAGQRRGTASGAVGEKLRKSAKEALVAAYAGTEG